MLRFYGQALAVPSFNAAAHARAMEMALGRREEVGRPSRGGRGSTNREQDVFWSLLKTIFEFTQC